MRRTLGVLCTVAPFVAALVAALSARHDLRLAWMAIVTTIVARVVVALGSHHRAGQVILLALAASTLAGCGVALLAGARAPFGVVATAVVVAAFATAGAGARGVFPVSSGGPPGKPRVLGRE